MSLPASVARWYHAALALFAVGALAGLLFSVFAPLAALSVYGVLIVALSALGFAASAFGLALESPQGARRLLARASQSLRGRSLDVDPFALRALQAPRAG